MDQLRKTFFTKLLLISMFVFDILQTPGYGLPVQFHEHYLHGTDPCREGSSCSSIQEIPQLLLNQKRSSPSAQQSATGLCREQGLAEVPYATEKKKNFLNAYCNRGLHIDQNKSTFFARGMFALLVHI